jgi:hypothetical protein
MALFVIKRKQARTTSSRFAGGDLLFSKQKAGSGMSIAIRLSGECMDRLRLRNDDRVIIEFDKHDQTGVWTLIRTDSEDGLTVSIKKNSRLGYLKWSADESMLSVVFPNCVSAYTATLESFKSDTATFLADYAKQ